MTDHTTPPALISVRAAAAALGVSTDTIYRLAGSGELRSIRVRGRRLIRPADLELYLDAHAAGGA